MALNFLPGSKMIHQERGVFVKRIFAAVLAGMLLLAGCSGGGKTIQLDICQSELPEILLTAGYGLYIDVGGDLYSWGYDGRNAKAVVGSYPGNSIGQGTEFEYNNIPTKIYSDVINANLGSRALTNNGDIIEWGNLLENDSCIPHIVRKNVIKVGLGLYLTESGELYSMPTRENIELEQDYKDSSKLILTGVKDFAIGYKYFALKDDGSVWTFLISSLTGKITENPKKLIDGVEKIITNLSMSTASFFIKNDGTLWAYGNNEYGQCGNGEHGDLDDSTRDCIVTEPYQLAGNVINAWVISSTTFYLTKDNQLYACGKNLNDMLLTGGNGQMLSDGYPKFVTTPVLVMENVKQMECSDMGMFVLKTDGTLWTWGYADKGTLGNGVYDKDSDLTEDGFVKRLVAGEAIQCQPTQIMDHVERLFNETLGLHFAQKTDGTIWYWGYGLIYVNKDNDWDTEYAVAANKDSVMYNYQKHYIIATPIQFTVETFFQNALDSISAREGIDTSQYQAVRYTEE